MQLPSAPPELAPPASVATAPVATLHVRMRQFRRSAMYNTVPLSNTERGLLKSAAVSPAPSAKPAAPLLEPATRATAAEGSATERIMLLPMSARYKVEVWGSKVTPAGFLKVAEVPTPSARPKAAVGEPAREVTSQYAATAVITAAIPVSVKHHIVAA